MLSMATRPKQIAFPNAFPVMYDAPCSSPVNCTGQFSGGIQRWYYFICIGTEKANDFFRADRNVFHIRRPHFLDFFSHNSDTPLHLNRRPISSPALLALRGLNFFFTPTFISLTPYLTTPASRVATPAFLITVSFPEIG